MRVYHLKPIEDDWTVTLEGVEKPVAAFSTKQAALNAARDLAERRNGRLVGFREDDTVEEIRDRHRTQKLRHVLPLGSVNIAGKDLARARFSKQSTWGKTS
jgi:hypothetical protein